MIYVWNVILVILYGIILRVYKNKKILNVLFCALCCIQFTLLIGLRYQTGADYNEYSRIYVEIYNIKGLDILNYYYIKEPLFVLLCKILQLFFCENYLSFHFAIGFLTMFFLMKAVLKCSKNTFMTIYLYLSFSLLYVCMNQVRQMLAVSIILYACYYLKEEDFKKYCKWIIVAAMFHNSAIIMLPFYFICKIKFDNKMLIRYCLIALGLFLGYELVLFLLSYLPYGSYIVHNYGVTFANSSILNFIYRFLLWIFVLCFRKIYVKDDDIYIGKLCHLVSACMVVQTLVLQNNAVARISTYFYVFFIYLIPEIACKIKEKKPHIIFNLTIYVGFTLVHYLYVKLYYGDTLIYKSIFEVIELSKY